MCGNDGGTKVTQYTNSGLVTVLLARPEITDPASVANELAKEGLR